MGWASVHGDRCRRAGYRRHGQRAVEWLITKIKVLGVGPAADRASEMDPAVTRDARARMRGHIDRSEAMGATVVVNGDVFKARQGMRTASSSGPTLLNDINSGMAARQGEILGPVLVLARTPHYRAAVELIHAHADANDVTVFVRDDDAARSRQRDQGRHGLHQPSHPDADGVSQLRLPESVALRRPPHARD
ncbi:aldehyde dehydrogenase family protein [Jannaschia formosa]|uniref:aldehyde dehydrogenase family protein n=1 Tax=Jannaschia formosa TaxID=2259592 RepID=UPI000E1BE289|nr:aldehyde dehydrogenase family protein [Jannaschia formosa]